MTTKENIQEIINEIDSFTSPDEMSKADAIVFMKDIISDLDSKIECLEEEMSGE